MRVATIVARVGHLALVPDIDPGAREDALHLQREDGGVGIERAVNAARLDERPHVRGG